MIMGHTHDVEIVDSSEPPTPSYNFYKKSPYIILEYMNDNYVNSKFKCPF
jgi:hypothetical protein